MIGEIITTGIGVANSAGLGMIVKGAVNAVTPATVSTVEKVCITVATATTGIAAERIIVRECKGYISDVKDTVKTIKTMAESKKLEKKEK